MTVILVLLCLAIAGRELYLAFDRKRGPSGDDLTDLHRSLTRDLTELRTVQDERIQSLTTQINERMLPDVNQRLLRHTEAIDGLRAEVSALRDHLAIRLDRAVAGSLGTDVPDTVGAALAASDHSGRPALTGAFDRLTRRHGLRTDLVVPVDDADMWRFRCYLTGRSPRALESEFIELLAALDTPSEGDNPLRELVDRLAASEQGGAQIGPLLLARTPEEFVVGVLPLAELARSDAHDILADPKDSAARLHRLPTARFRDLPPPG